ncbi:hypothetical protein [Leifsonia aquatica]|jgi:hypothetical protein|uniref:hypothetical protein n=1 Tax=Leifsonia aquatica TaxID=144185 RepID=UPI00380D51BB
MAESTTTHTLLVPGFGLVTCTTVAITDAAGDVSYRMLLTAVDEFGRPIDQVVRVRTERILGLSR